eukprot:TRINITY_DN99227_c0_g1_i1.p1 TRINITY_DN99227_c0_g1~~TRINITY_DN99227_c0_g1_i1.p1  ORF type:complete len:208 (-),score=32.20 TRINITY_DN99227_c0_g1_i1:133-756(-)
MSSIFVSCSEALDHVVDKDKDDLLTQPFLEVSKQFLPVVDSFGVGLSIVKNDIGGNIEKIEKGYKLDTEKYKYLFELVRTDVAAGNHVKSQCITKSVLWLKRAMEFSTTMLQLMAFDKSGKLSVCDAANSSYDKTLRPFHGYIAFGAFKTAINFVPSRESFFERLGGRENGKDLVNDMKIFLSKFQPILQRIHVFLEQNGLNDPTRV